MNVNARPGSVGLKPLVRAAVQNGNVPLVFDYLHNGGEVDARDRLGRTPLMIAASRGHAHICTILLDHGADQIALDEAGQSALDIARSGGHPDVVSLLESRASPFHSQNSLATADETGSGLLGSWTIEEEIEEPIEERAVRDRVIEIQKAGPPDRNVDQDVDWSDLQIDLPDPRWLEVQGTFQREDVQELLAALIGETRIRGSFRMSLVEAVTRELDGSAKDDIPRHVLQAVGDLGYVLEEDEEDWGRGHRLGDEWEVDPEFRECLQYLQDLHLRTNDPYWYVRKDVERSVLLDREGEERIGKMIALSIKDACSAISADKNVLPALTEMHREAAKDSALVARLTRIHEVSEQAAEEAGDETALSAIAPEHPGRFSGLLADAMVACQPNYAAAQDTGAVRCIEGLELTTFGMRTLERSLRECGSQPDQLTNAIQRIARLECELFAANIRLAISVAEKFRWSRLSQMDRIQEANLGLLKAIDRFDFERGFKFSTYATWWLRQSVTRAINDKARMIRVPVHMMERVSKLARVARELGFEYAREVPIAILAELSEYPEADVQKALSVVDDPVLWEDSPEDAALVLAQVDEGASPSCDAERAQMERIVFESISGLNPRDAEVIRHRFGLFETSEKTLEEVGQLFDLTRERIRQIESKALEKLRNPSNRIAALSDYVPEHA